jgi:hypothetical protein
VIALQITDPSSRQRRCPTWRRKKTIATHRNLKSGHLPQIGLGTKTNWPTDCRSQYILNLIFVFRQSWISYPKNLFREMQSSHGCNSEVIVGRDIRYISKVSEGPSFSKGSCILTLYPLTFFCPLLVHSELFFFPCRSPLQKRNFRTFRNLHTVTFIPVVPLTAPITVSGPLRPLSSSVLLSLCLLQNAYTIVFLAIMWIFAFRAAAFVNASHWRSFLQETNSIFRQRWHCKTTEALAVKNMEPKLGNGPHRGSTSSRRDHNLTHMLDILL